MPLVTKVAGFDNAYLKNIASGDKVQFVTAQSGVQYLVQMTTVPATATARGIDITSLTDPIFTLPFEYLKGFRQLEVYEMAPTTHDPSKLVELSVYNEAIAGGYIDAGSPPASDPYFEEISKNEVQIINSSATDRIYLFSIPHTALSSVNEERLVVADQPDNQALDIKGPGNGIVLTAPNGTRYFLSVTDPGRLDVGELT